MAWTILHCWLVWNSCISSFSLIIAPSIQCVGINNCFFSICTCNVFWFHLSNWALTWTILHSWLVWNSGISSFSLIIAPSIQCIGFIYRISSFFTVWISCFHIWNNFRIRSTGTILHCRLIWNSRVSSFSLIIAPFIQLIGINNCLFSISSCNVFWFHLSDTRILTWTILHSWLVWNSSVSSFSLIFAPSIQFISFNNCFFSICACYIIFLFNLSMWSIWNSIIRIFSLFFWPSIKFISIYHCFLAISSMSIF